MSSGAEIGMSNSLHVNLVDWTYPSMEESVSNSVSVKDSVFVIFFDRVVPFLA